MSNQPEILVIDDESQIRKLLQITLDSNDYMVRQAINGKEGLISAANHPPSLIILDLGLPDMDGQDLLKQLREWFTNPVIILSVKNSQEEIIQALDSGANDYLVKPFRTGELLARIRSALRVSFLADNNPVIVYGDLCVDLSSRSVKKGEEFVKLTVTEYALLTLLVKNNGKVLTHHYLLREVWGPGFINQSQYLRVFIAQLRKKIETDPNRPQFIFTESGVGYRFASIE